MPLTDLEKSLIQAYTPHVNHTKKQFFPKFFQSFPGGYGEGDKFVGVTVPVIRKSIQPFTSVSIDDIFHTLHTSQFHEVRLGCLLLLVTKYNSMSEKERSKVISKYLAHKDYINNWDLVDSSTYKLLGRYYFDHNKSLIPHAKSLHFWERRMGIVGNIWFIKNGETAQVYTIAKYIISTSHDYHEYLKKTHSLSDSQAKFWNSLVHKAMGWMLREAGKVDEKELIGFLSSQWVDMPSVMRSYAIEKLSISQKTSLKKLSKK